MKASDPLDDDDDVFCKVCHGKVETVPSTRHAWRHVEPNRQPTDHPAQPDLSVPPDANPLAVYGAGLAMASARDDGGSSVLDGMDWHDEPDGLYPTRQAYDICERLIPETRELFLRNNRKYRRVGNELGSRGVIPDINRKHGVILSRVWDGAEVVGEDTRTLIMEQVGHLFLLLHMLDSEQDGRAMGDR